MERMHSFGHAERIAHLINQPEPRSDVGDVTLFLEIEDLLQVLATWSHVSHGTRIQDTRIFILEWTTSLDTSFRTLFVREGGREDVHVKGGCPCHVELRNYVISRQIVERRVT